MATPCYEFGPFILDPAKRLLLQEHKTVPLTGKVFDTLMVLVQNRDRVVGKDELLRLVWPDSIVEESNLTVNIHILRKIFGEHPTDRAYILTVPGHGYRFVAGVREVKGEGVDGIPESPAGLPRARQSIAVLPLKPLGLESPDMYLGFGMADALITRLSNVRQLAVRPSRTVFKYSGLELDPVAVGQELKVDAVLDGTIRRSGEYIRVTVQLVNPQDGSAIWGGQFDEKLTDLFAVEDSISEQLSQTLTLQLTGEEARQLTKRHTYHHQAYQHYLRGRYHWNRRTADGFRKAAGAFQQAIEQDPTFALAHTGLADTYVTLGFWDVAPPREVMPKGAAAALEALSIDETVSEAHVSIGLISALYDWDWQASEREFTRAIELNPGNVEARYVFANTCLGPLSLHDRALGEMKEAREYDPVSPLVHAYASWHLCLARRYDEAAKVAEDGIEIEPHFLTYMSLGRAYEQKVMMKEAVGAFLNAVEISEHSPFAVASLGHAYALSGRKAEARKLLASLKNQMSQRYVSPERLAYVHLGLKEHNHAIEHLQQAYADRSGWLVFLNVDPNYDPLRSDPRFARLVRDMGLAS